MEYPLISEYREAILSAAENLQELSSLRPVLDDRGEPVMSSGNFAVVFKMREEGSGKQHALKCFLKEQEGRDVSYKKIADELETVSSPYILPLRYLEKELFVDSGQCSEEEFPVVVMEWVEGETLDAYLTRHLGDPYELAMLGYRFNRMAAWLLAQPFAHGDLKPDNILVRGDGSLVLVDYDGMFVPSMKGEKAREIGSPDYRHPLRTDADFSEHLDDFPIAVIALSLKAIALNPGLKSAASATDSLLLSESDFRDAARSERLKAIQALSSDAELSLLLGAFYVALAKNSLDLLSFRLFMTEKPKQLKQKKQSKETSRKVKKNIEKIDTSVTEEDIANGIEDKYGVVYSKDGTRLLKSKRNLEQYTVKEGTKVICDSAFEWCESLASIVLPSSVTSIGANPFRECRSLRIELSSQQNFRIINGMLIDRKGCLISCLNGQEEVVLPDFVTSIGVSAFGGCSSLASIVLPSSVTSIGDYAFSRCSSLTSIVLPSSVTSIGDYAFSRCSSLTSIVLPSSVTSIGDHAFSWCSSLVSIVLPSSVTSIGANPFGKCRSLRIELSSQQNFRIINGMLIDKKGCLISCLNGQEEVVVPDSVTSIGDYAFWWCKSLASIDLPSSVTSIGACAFSCCHSLQSIVLPSFVTSIGNSAFRWCTSLASISIPDTLKDSDIEKAKIPEECQIIRRK